MSKCNNEKEAEASHHYAYAKQSGLNGVKNEKFQMEKGWYSFHPNPEHRLQVPSEPLHLVSSNKQPHSTSGAETRKIMYTPANTSPSYIEWDLSGF